MRSPLCRLTASILNGVSPGRLLLASFRNRNVVDDVDNAVGGFHVRGCGNATINDQSAVFVIEHQAFALKSYGGALVEEFSRFLLAFQVVILENFLQSLGIVHQTFTVLFSHFAPAGVAGHEDGALTAGSQSSDHAGFFVGFHGGLEFGGTSGDRGQVVMTNYSVMSSVVSGRGFLRSARYETETDQKRGRKRE